MTDQAPPVRNPISGGKDSTAMALALKEREPSTPFVYVCTPTGDELPEMFEHWRKLGDLLGSRVLPVVGGTFRSMCDEQGALPNWRMRFCTRLLKIAPYQAWLAKHLPVVSYVGLRADEEEREGATHGGDLALPGAYQTRYPLREWGWTIHDVWGYLDERDIDVPERTDCARCFFQTLGEWWRLWRDHPDIYADAESMEEEFGHTFRSEGRDSWPAGLKDLRERFEAGEAPKNANQIDLFRRATCRVCTL